jgi:predicted P-loop ATPase
MADLVALYRAIGDAPQLKPGQVPSLTPGQLSLKLRSELGDRLGFNELKLASELDGEPIPVAALEHLYVTLSEQGWRIGKQQAMDAFICAARKNPYHPVRQYLEHLEDDDSLEEIDLWRLATTHLGTVDPLYDAMLARTLISAVSRAMEPGCKVDTCCVLRGPQGVFKSTAWKTLASPGWFCDTWQESEKDLRLAIQTAWLYELAELDHMTGKREAGQIKALFSSAEDKFRAPYGAAMDDHPRPSIFVGTCNRDDFLRDDTGSRRYWVIEITQPIGIIQLREDRDRIWRAAMLAWRAGELPILSPADQAESERRNLGYEVDHPWLAMLHGWINSIISPVEFTTHEALEGAGCRAKASISRKDETEVAQLLRQLGYEKDRHQPRADGIRQPRKWRLAQPVSTSNSGDETGKTPDHPGDAGPLSQPLNLFSEKGIEIGVGTADGENTPEVFPKKVEAVETGSRSADDVWLEQHLGKDQPDPFWPFLPDALVLVTGGAAGPNQRYKFQRLYDDDPSKAEILSANGALVLVPVDQLRAAA